MLLLLCAFLLVWCPLTFAVELGAVLPSLGLRGPIAAVELGVHGGAAAIALAGGWSLWTGGPQALTLVRAALVASAAVSVQSLYWSVLPGQTKPGDELPLAGLAIAHAGAWLLYLRGANASA